jgi:hypothetical protein
MCILKPEQLDALRPVCLSVLSGEETFEVWGFTSQVPVSKKVRMRSFHILSNMAVPALFRVLHVVEVLLL